MCAGGGGHAGWCACPPRTNARNATRQAATPHPHILWLHIHPVLSLWCCRTSCCCCCCCSLGPNGARRRCRSRTTMVRAHRLSHRLEPIPAQARSQLAFQAGHQRGASVRERCVHLHKGGACGGGGAGGWGAGWRLGGGWAQPQGAGRGSGAAPTCPNRPPRPHPPARILAYASAPLLTPPTPMMGRRPLVRRYMSRSTSVEGSIRGAPDSPPACTSRQGKGARVWAGRGAGIRRHDSACGCSTHVPACTAHAPHPARAPTSPPCACVATSPGRVMVVLLMMRPSTPCLSATAAMSAWGCGGGRVAGQAGGAAALDACLRLPAAAAACAVAPATPPALDAPPPT